MAPDTLFGLLLRPSAIREWWGAARAIVLPERGGFWVAAWGESEDDPDYLTMATIATLEPPRRLVLADYRYYSKSGNLPFQADFVTEFIVAPTKSGSSLRITQDGFPCQPEADEFFEACRKGWEDTFAGIRRFLQSAGESPER